MGEVRNGDQKVRKHLFSEILYGGQVVFYEEFFKNYLGWRGPKLSLKLSSGAQSENLEPSRRIQEFFSKKYSSFICSVCVCVCVFSSHPFWTSSSLDVPAGVTQEEGHTGFLIHLPPAVRALIFVARRIQPFLSLVDREVEFCVLTN